MMTSTRWSTAIGPVAVTVSGLCFGGLGLFGQWFADRGIGVAQMLAIRFGGSAVCLWGVLLLTKRIRPFDSRSLLAVAVLGLLYVGEAACYFISAKRIPVGLTALLLYLYPSMVTLYEWLVVRKPQHWLSICALMLSFFGVTLCVGTPEIRLDVLGVALGILTAAIYTVYIIVGARMPTTIGALQKSAALMTVSGLIFATMASLQSPWPIGALVDARQEIAWLLIVGTLIPIPLLLFGLTRVKPSSAAVMSTVEPLTALVIGAVALSQSLNMSQTVGAVLIGGAVLLASFQEQRSTKFLPNAKSV
jgi:drug/metabolite transporter (DMT)-like permease